MKTLLSLLIFHLLLGLGPSARGSEIIGGKEVPDKSMKYMALVQSDQRICGGFLIRKDFVLTAAHCYSKNITVVLGTHNLKKVSDSMRYRVKSYKHPDFRHVKYGNDIMLLKLQPQKSQRDHRIQPIQISKSAFKLKNNAKCHVAGWGLTKQGKPSDVLQMVEVPVVKMDYCRKEWREYGRLELPKDVICAGGYDTTAGFCQGDSGGPLVCGKQAVGIVSFNMNQNCDYPNLPNIYVDISKHQRWIKKILAKKS